MNTAWRTVALILEIGLMTGGMAIVAGCNGKCSGVYSCPDDIPYGSLSTTDLPSPLVEVSADEPCTATFVNGDAGAATVQVIDRIFPLGPRVLDWTAVS